jgi:hypothetical protein
VAGRLSSSDPSLLENVGFVLSKATGSHPGEPVTVMAIFDVLVAAGVVAVLLALAGETRHRLRGR